MVIFDGRDYTRKARLFLQYSLKKDNLPTNYLKNPEKKKLRLLLVNNKEQ